jgi:hypothetical protein
MNWRLEADSEVRRKHHLGREAGLGCWPGQWGGQRRAGSVRRNGRVYQTFTREVT